MADELRTTTVYLGNLDPAQVTRRILYEVGIQAGPVVAVKLPMEGTRNKGFGFVEYDSAEDAAYAVSLFRGYLRLFDRIVRVDFSGKAAGAGSGAGGMGSGAGGMGRAASFGGGASGAAGTTPQQQQPERAGSGTPVGDERWQPHQSHPQAQAHTQQQQPAQQQQHHQQQFYQQQQEYAQQQQQQQYAQQQQHFYQQQQPFYQQQSAAMPAGGQAFAQQLAAMQQHPQQHHFHTDMTPYSQGMMAQVSYAGYGGFPPATAALMQLPPQYPSPGQSSMAPQYLPHQRQPPLPAWQ